MNRKTFYSRRVIEKRKRRLRSLERRPYALDMSSESEEENQLNNAIEKSTTTTTTHVFPTVTNDFIDDENYHDDEHDNIEIPNETNGNGSSDQSPPLYDGCRFSVKESIKLLMEFLICDVNLDKKNISRLLKLIKRLLPQPNTLPVTWKSIVKLFGRTNLFSTTFLCSLCLTKCGKTTNNSRVCRNESCVYSKRTLKTNETVELVHLDIRTQLKSVINRNINFLLKNEPYTPTCDISNGSFYRANKSNSIRNTITLVLHTDGAPLIRTTKQSIWPLFASIVEIPPPVREYQKNILLLGLWSSKTKPDVNVFLKHTV